MKKLTIELTDEAHLELLSIQLEKKQARGNRTTLVQVASDVFSEFLEEKTRNKKAAQK